MVAAGIGYLAVTGLRARAELDHVRTELPALRQALVTGDLSGAASLRTDIESRSIHAHQLTSGPAWWAAGHVPVLGRPIDTMRRLAAASQTVAQQVLPGVVGLAQTVTDKGTTLRHGATFNMQTIATLAGTVHRADAAGDQALSLVQDASHHTWFSTVDDARATLAGNLADLQGYLAGADRTLQLAGPMLGASGERRYFIGIENEAEARGLGGLPGAYIIATADHGTISFVGFGNDSAFNGIRPSVSLGADFDALYRGATPETTFVNSDISPNFTDAARIWAATWTKKTGQRIDGAIAVDPTALSYLLAVTGPADLGDGRGAISADNIVDVTEREQYAAFHTDAQRNAFAVEVARSVAGRVLAGNDTLGLARAATRGAQERRVVLWDADPTIEAALAQAGYAGTIGGNDRPVSGFTVVNAAGTKLDYYLDRAMTYRRTGCAAGSTVVATLTLHNGAPRSGLPQYVTGRSDTRAATSRPGDNRLLVSYFGSHGARLESVTIDGEAVTLATATENGLTTATTDLELPVGATRTITVTLSEPAAAAAVQILQQPLVRPLIVAVQADRCQ